MVTGEHGAWSMGRRKWRWPEEEIGGVVKEGTLVGKWL
jgi:hypothetical protein